jgi:hypothetical protein
LQSRAFGLDSKRASDGFSTHYYALEAARTQQKYSSKMQKRVTRG